MREHFKGVIWPHGTRQAKVKGEKDLKTVYRYAIIGCLVTDAPIPKFDGKNEVVLDGATNGFVTILESFKGRKAKFKAGDANGVITTLDHI